MILISPSLGFRELVFQYLPMPLVMAVYFYENAQTVSSDYTVTSGNNAMSAGPITINNGITVTIPSNSTLTIV